jgi:hypothetical protein
VKIEPEDKINGSTIDQKENQNKMLSTSVNDPKRRRRCIVEFDDSEDEGNGKCKSKAVEKALPNNMKSVHGKSKNATLEDDEGPNVGYTKYKTSVTGARRMTRSFAEKACKDTRPKRENKYPEFI